MKPYDSVVNQSERRPVDPKPVIGLLGAPGAGKSSIAGIFARLGCGVIDSDRLAQELLDTPEVCEQLAQWWGPGMLAPDGRVDRKAVASVVFVDADKRERLEGLIHPQVHQKRVLLRQAFQADNTCLAIVEDCPLILEAGLQDTFDVLVYIDVPTEVRQQRVAAIRGWSVRELHLREENQAPLDIKRSSADYILDNGADLGAVEAQVRRVLQQILDPK